jgi:hypothetical protein
MAMSWAMISAVGRPDIKPVELLIPLMGTSLPCRGGAQIPRASNIG